MSILRKRFPRHFREVTTEELLGHIADAGDVGLPAVEIAKRIGQAHGLSRCWMWGGLYFKLVVLEQHYKLIESFWGGSKWPRQRHYRIADRNWPLRIER